MTYMLLLNCALKLVEEIILNILNVLFFQTKIPACLCACGVIRLVFVLLSRCAMQVRFLTKPTNLHGTTSQSKALKCVMVKA